MVPYGSPLIRHFGEGDKLGYTLVQLIETSSIVAHFCEETNDAYIDIFSCKPFDQKVAEAVIQKYFKPESIKTVVMGRSATQFLL